MCILNQEVCILDHVVCKLDHVMCKLNHVMCKLDLSSNYTPSCGPIYTLTSQFVKPRAKIMSRSSTVNITQDIFSNNVSFSRNLPEQNIHNIGRTVAILCDL